MSETSPPPPPAAGPKHYLQLVLLGVLLGVVLYLGYLLLPLLLDR